MKKLFVVIALVFAANLAQAQEFKPFQLYLGLGYTVPEGGGGVLFDFEPAYRINDKIAAGFRYEAAVMARVVNNTEASAAAVGSYTLNGRYYFSNGSFRPYAGLGFGLYSLASVQVDTNNNGGGGADVGSKFGFYPRIGFDWGHFNINLDYNLIPVSTVENLNGNGETYEIKNSYIGIRIGAFIFGGRN